MIPDGQLTHRHTTRLITRQGRMRGIKVFVKIDDTQVRHDRLGLTDIQLVRVVRTVACCMRENDATLRLHTGNLVECGNHGRDTHTS